MEEAEDLGALASGPHEGLRPASMWQWPQLADVLRKGLRTVVFHQLRHSLRYTRLLLRTPLEMPDFVFESLPCYDASGFCSGPLPCTGLQQHAASVNGYRHFYCRLACTQLTPSLVGMRKLRMTTCYTTPGATPRALRESLQDGGRSEAASLLEARSYIATFASYGRTG